MVSRYPYFLQVLMVPKLEVTDATDRDANGNWLPNNSINSALQYCTVSPCRNGGANGGANGDLTYVANGVKYMYEFEVFAPKACPTVAVGSKIRVVESDGTIRREGIVQRHERNQLHTRLWV